MPTYYFNIHDGGAAPDPEAHELPDLDAAKRVAIRLSGDLIREMGENFWRGEEWRMEVTDESGAVLFGLRFTATPPSAAQPSQLIAEPRNVLGE